MMQHQRIVRAALSLPEADRADLADKLLLSLDPSGQNEIDALWAREAESRIDAYERGEITAIPGEEVFSAIRARQRR